MLARHTPYTNSDGLHSQLHPRTNPSPSPSPALTDSATDMSSAASSASTVSTSDKIPVELWSLIVSFVAARRGRIGSATRAHDDPYWRRDLLRLAHTCRAAYVAGFSTLWSDLRIEFIRHDMEMTLELAKVENSVEEDRHVEDRLRTVRRLRRRFDLSMVWPASKRRADKELVRRVIEVTECALVAPLCVIGGKPYLASLVENERDQNGAGIAASVKSLWAAHLPLDWDCQVILTSNGLVLTPYPLHHVRHLALNDFDASVDLGTDLFPPNSQSIRRRQSWKHCLPFVLKLPNPLNVQSILFYINSNSTHRLYLELINKYPRATDLDIAFAGDHEHRVSRFTPSAKRIRLHLDGDLDDFGDTPDLFYTEDEQIATSMAAVTLADTEPKPIYPDDALPFAVTVMESRGRTSFLPFDDEEIGMHFLYVLPTLTRLVIDHDFEIDNSDYGNFPIFLPALKEFTICMRIADLIFSHNNLSAHLPAGQVAFPALESFTLVNDLDQTKPSDANAMWPPMIPDIPDGHMPGLSVLHIPSHCRGKPVFCTMRVGWMQGINLDRFLVPNVSMYLADPNHLAQPIVDNEDFGNFVWENAVTVDAAVLLSLVPCRSLRKLVLTMHDSVLNPMQALPGLSWSKTVEDLTLDFSGAREVDPSWVASVSRWPKLRKLTLRVTNATGQVEWISADTTLSLVEELVLDMPDAIIDLSLATGAVFPQLSKLTLNVARANDLSCDMIMTRLSHLNMVNHACPLLVQCLLKCAPPVSACKITCASIAELDPELAAVENLDGTYPQPTTTAGDVNVEWVYTGTEENVRVWYELLHCAPCVFGAAASVSTVTIRVAADMDAVDAELVGRVAKRLVGREHERVKVAVVVEEGFCVEGAVGGLRVHRKVGKMVV
ncbi:hypothetical protein BCR44DRAFT_60041 [Catenaria anguillulae PL171]|uniref:Uncharacterized protein n=1 Tax=Catenaria anguillulae PL171 TaxID=765915 RepID=A0A1Y2HUZ0_9FUNG|nr:hypothetical protein BCR44DRAFT_60041 [Catenaria anguillulae PL171]